MSSALILLFAIQAAGGGVTVVDPASTPVSHPGVVYEEITGTYVPIIGWKQTATGPHEIEAGTKLQYKRIGQKVGDAAVPR